jgi:hypothetical protein
MLDNDAHASPAPPAGADDDADIGLRALQRRLSAFREAREWAVHHTPRNLLLAVRPPPPPPPAVSAPRTASSL